jgi:hypothetical protein
LRKQGQSQLSTLTVRYIDSSIVQVKNRFGCEITSALAALQRLSELESRGRVAPDMARRLRCIYEDRQAENKQDQGREADDRDVRSELIEAERSPILSLREQGRISDHALGRLQRKLDLRESLLA